MRAPLNVLIFASLLSLGSAYAHAHAPAAALASYAESGEAGDLFEGRRVMGSGLGSCLDLEDAYSPTALRALVQHEEFAFNGLLTHSSLSQTGHPLQSHCRSLPRNIELQDEPEKVYALDARDD